MVGPGAINLDFGWCASFALAERWHLQCRADAFDDTNAPHFSNPSATVSSMDLNRDRTIKSLGGLTTNHLHHWRHRRGRDRRADDAAWFADPVLAPMKPLHLRSGALALGCALCSFAAYAQSAGSSVLHVGFREAGIAGRSAYNEPATRSEEGMPVGNGRMGSLVWTTPSALHFQINRVDVFGRTATRSAFPRTTATTPAAAVTWTSIWSNAGDDVFAGDDFHQHLSLYDGTDDGEGQGRAPPACWPGRSAT